MDTFTISERIDLYDRTKAVLFRAGYQADDIAEALTTLTRGPRVTARAISHLRSALVRGELWAIEVSDRFFWWARKNLTASVRNPGLAGTAANTWTVGVHLARELARFRTIESARTNRSSPGRNEVEARTFGSSHETASARQAERRRRREAQ